ncbi:phage head morphogenesis protein, SPP1 gp7 family [Methanocaldococcus vulcanius M7]|uniref:Phage head morphogenesis protein, SPP1 gp7 family n=1 Tax=Methanocaldococcus vulcanius (strain ATCC 700851 / DSM 12094 / M7) TaxID=579137 RepID=C9RFS0_METVM|nr:phage minor head protein [Methanocaldococcus vulcanius]ACX72422.1 phage head morphogenesis protein, SPP1 gp7 family [Methanocaldococcus vulcanius M7]
MSESEGKIVVDYFGESPATKTTEVGVSDRTPADIELGEFSTIQMIDITDEANLEGAFLIDEKVNLALHSLIYDIISNWTLKGDEKQIEEVKKWLYETGIIFSKNATATIIEMLRDYFIYGKAIYQIVWENGKIVRLHRLDPKATKIIRNPFGDDRIIIHDATIDGQIRKIGFIDLERKEEVLNLFTVKSEMVQVWLDINDIILLEGTSLMARCVNAVYQKQKLLNEICAYVNEHQAIPPVQIKIGQILSDGRGIGLPDGTNITVEKFKEMLKNYANDITKLKYKGAVATPCYVDYNQIDMKINWEYIKFILDKYDEIIFNAFYSSEGLWKSGVADYRRKDMRRERLKLIRSMQAKIKELINELIRMNFGDIDVEFTFITDDTEELLEKSEYYKNVADTIKSLADIGASEDTLKRIAQEFGIELDLALQKGQAEMFAEMFAEIDKETIEAIAQTLVDKIMEKIENATLEVKDKAMEIIQENKGKITATAYRKIRALINKEFQGLDFSGEIQQALSDIVRVTGLEIDIDKGVIQFVKNYTFDLCKKLTENQKARLRHILLEELSTTEDTNITQKIMDTLKTTRHEAERIARTELSRAYEWSRYEYYKKYAEKNKVKVMVRWYTRKDGKVCPKCRVLEGKEWEIDKVPVKPPLHPNCRCSLGYKIVDVKK